MRRAEEKANPQAAALRYEPPKDAAPRVIAKGRGRLAEKIIEVALRNGIPIREDPDLVHILSKLDLEEEIPAEVYQVIAEILAFIYHVNSHMGINEK